MASFIFYSSKSYNKVQSKISQCLAPTLFGTEIIWYHKKEKKIKCIAIKVFFLGVECYYFSVYELKGGNASTLM